MNTKFHSLSKEIHLIIAIFLYCSVIALHCFLNDNASFLDKIYELLKGTIVAFVKTRYIYIPSQWKRKKNKTNLITCHECPQVCYHWRCGFCKSGDNCKFKHESIDFNRIIHW